MIRNLLWRRMAGWLFSPLGLLLPCVASAAFVWPVEGILTSDYGLRNGRPHRGVDVAAPVGQPVHAVESGRVLWASSRGEYGLLVELQHESGWTSRYAHLDESQVSVGDWVHQGAQIGKVGESGNATGPHLHFEVRREGKDVDPFSVLP